MKLISKILFVFIFFFFDTVTATDADCNRFQDALHQLFQGEYSIAEEMTSKCPVSIKLQKLKIRLLIAKQETELATKALENLIKIHQKISDVHYFSGIAWSRLARQVSIFSKTSYYKKATLAFIRAGHLEPDNPLFLLEQAKAYGQPDSLGGNQPLQAGVVAKLSAMSQAYGFLAKMDLAQNKRDYQQLKQLADQAVKYDPTNYLIVERAAQAYRTIDDEVKAQKLFLKACQLPAPKGELRESWRFSCYLVSYIAINETDNHQLAIEALVRLLQFYHAATPPNNEIRQLLIEHAVEVNNLESAKNALNAVLDFSYDKHFKEKASKTLSRITSNN